MNHELNDLLRNQKILICVGSGGVGKTTISAGLGVRAAQIGMRVLIMTIDPALRLRVALGLQANGDSFRKVPNQNYKGELYATWLNPEKIFDDFILSSANDKSRAHKLIQNRLYKQLSTTLSGSQEFTSLLQLSRMVDANNFDLIILDTPPAQHAAEFLEAPQKIEALFQGAIMKWFMGHWQETSLVKKLISRGTKTVLSALELITGSQFMNELNEFFQSVGSVQAKIIACTESVNGILRAKDTGFILVTGFDEAKLIEAAELRTYLEREQYHLAAGVINRAFVGQKGDVGKIQNSLQAAFQEWANYHESREAQYALFTKHWGRELPVVRVPDLNHDIDGLYGLEVVANELEVAFHSYDSSRV